MNKEVLADDLSAIVSAHNPRAGSISYEVIIYNSTKQEEVVVTLLKEIVFRRDYNSDYMEKINLSFNLAGDDYARVLGGNGDNLEAAITENLETQDGNISRTNRYIFLLTSNSNNRDTSQDRNINSSEAGKNTIMMVEGECVDRCGAALLSCQVSGVHNGGLKDIIVREVKEQTPKATVDGQPLKIDVDMVEPDVETIFSGLDLPTGLVVTELPGYLQKKKYGVYNGGLGCFLQYSFEEKRYIYYVYPLYSKERVDKESKKLMIYYPSDPKYTTTRNTWIKDGELLKILASEVNSQNTGNNSTIARGNTAVFADPSKTMKRTDASASGSKFTYDGSDSLNESNGVKVNSGMGERSTYLGNISNVPDSRTDYILQEMINVSIRWRDSDPDVITPGMPVKFISTHSEYGIMEQNGTVQGIMTVYNKTHNNISSLLTLKVSLPEYKKQETYS